MPSVTGEDITLGPSTNGGIDLTINGSPLARLNDTVISIKPTNITQYVDTEYYSATVTYSSVSDDFDVAYSGASYATDVLALAAAPTPNSLNFYVCQVTAQVVTSTPVAATRALYAQENTDELSFYDSPDASTQTSTQSVAVHHLYYKGLDIAVSNVNNTFAQSWYDAASGGKNVIRLFNLTTLAFIGEVSSTTVGANDSHRGPAIVYNDVTDKYIIFTAYGSYPANHLITHHDPLTGAETSGTQGSGPFFSSNEAAKFMVYIPLHDIYLYVKSQHHSYSFQSASVTNYAITTVPGISGNNTGSLVYDSVANELWWYDRDSDAKVFDVSVHPAPFTITYNRDVTTPFQDQSYGVFAGYLESGVIPATVTNVEVVDKRGVLTENTSPGPLYSGSDATISSSRTYDTLVIDGALSITAATTVTGAVLVDGDLTIDADCVFNGDLTVKGTLTVNGKLSVLGDLKAYNIAVDTVDHFDFFVGGSIKFGSPVAGTFTSTKLFNVGGDIGEWYVDGFTNVALTVTHPTSTLPNMKIGGNIIVYSFNFTSTDNGAAPGSSKMVLEIKGSVVTREFFNLESNAVSANRKIAPSPDLIVRGSMTVRSLNLAAGNNSFAGTSAYGGATGKVFIHGDVTVTNSMLWRTGSGTGIGGRCGNNGNLQIYGNLTGSGNLFDGTSHISAGGSKSASAPTYTGSLFVGGDMKFTKLYAGFYGYNSGGGTNPKYPSIVCNGNLQVAKTLYFGSTTTGLAPSGNAAWKANSFYINDFINNDTTENPSTCLKYSSTTGGLCKIEVGKYNGYSASVLPGFVSGAAGSVDFVPDSIFASNSGTAVYRDTTGSGTSYIWRAL